MNNNEQGNTELSNFIGIYIDSLLKEGYPAETVKNMMVNTLMREVLAVSAEKEDNAYNQYALIPLYLSVSFLLRADVSKMIQSMGNKQIPQISSEITKLNHIISYFEKRVENLQKFTQ